jgi:pimeloyl-ACP methyl ester carboxylesterase
MKYLFLFLSWFFSVIFILLTISMLLMKNWLQGILLLLLILIVLPPVRILANKLTKIQIPWWGRAAFIILLLALFVWFSSRNEYTSAIYNSPEVKSRFIEMYDLKMEKWPVPYEDIFIDTEYGKVHVIVSGPKEAPPVILLHASGVGGWSWLHNARGLTEHFRIYAIDTLGDAGKSELYNRDHYPQDGLAQAELCSQITEKLGIKEAFVIGASEGGFTGSNYALYSPKRVKKLVLLGPMGYSGTTESVFRIIFIQFFPLKSVQNNTIPWAFGDDPKVLESVNEWFKLMMTGTFPQKARPVTFTAEQRQRLRIPILMILGKNDNLVGDPEKTKKLVRDIPNVRIETLETGHLIGVEQPEKVNSLIIEFLSK